MFGGSLVKAKFVCYPGTEDNMMGGTPWEMPFFLNPASIKTHKEVSYEDDAGAQRTLAIRFSHVHPTCLELGELWFDTYDTRKSVREQYIDKLEDLCNYDPETHYPPVVVFHFGEFSQATKHKYDYTFFVSKLDVDYTMFLADGTPVRAQVAICLKQVLTASGEQVTRDKRSPDHARVYTVKRGDTLQGIARFAYEDPREWRRIANSNAIDDPMDLRPGRVLVLPPILR